MAFFALLWKARTIENYRVNYEKEKINSIVLGNAQLEKTLSLRWRHYRFNTKKRLSRIFKKLYPEGSVVSNFFLYLMTDQTFPNFLLKSVMGFVGGIILTYLCFMFFVFQLAISLIHATIMSSIIGVLLTLGLAFSYRIRCLVFLLIPQFFSRVGRYTLTCYALVLILTGPATNTLKNSEVLSESMACSQEQIKTSVHQLNDLMKKPINAMKDSLKLMVDQLKIITAKVKETAIRLDRLVLSIVNTIQSSFSWLQSVADICNAKLGSPYDRCCSAIQDGFSHCQKTLGPKGSLLCNVAYVAQAACYSVKPFKQFCYATEFMDEAILASVKRKLKNFTEHLRAMFHVEVHIHHSYSYSSNTSRSASQVAAGIVTEIRNRADPLLTWLSWSSCVTSLFLLLIIFRAKYYQHMYETRSRFDNRYVTKELQELDLKRQQQGRETVLPLNRRERAKYITTSSFRLVASEKVYLNRSAVFMAITTFKLLIHMVADYSLYWVLMTIRYHGRFQSDLMPGIPRTGAHVSGSGFVARLFSAIVGILDIPLSFPAPSPISCLPDPYPPDLRRYAQIGVLIFLLWFFALFEPYGLRLRHLIMGHYRPERAKARATWLYNHILRTRGSFMKFARRKLHREYKYSSEASLTLRQWITDHVPFQCFRTLIGLGPSQQHCLLCGITSSSDPDSRLTKCQTTGCPGIFCNSCFKDIGELCTICLSPADYGDLSDVSLEKGSSDDSDSDAELSEGRINEYITLHSTTESDRTIKSTGSKDENRRWSFFTKTTGPRGPLDTIALLHTGTSKKTSFFTTFFQKRFRNLNRNMKKRCRVKKHTVAWVAELTRDNRFNFQEENHKYYSKCHDIEEYGEFDDVIDRGKSIGVNTDRNRGVLLNMLVNSFTRRRFKQSRTKQKNTNPELKLYKNLPIRRKNEHSNGENSKGTLFSTKSFHAHHSTIRQRNLKNIIRSKKDSRTNNKRKGCEEPKGIMKAIRHFLKSNEIKNMSNQINDNAPNNTPNEIDKKFTKPLNNANVGEKKNKKKCSKGNKPKRPRKQKDANKIKTKNTRHRIAECHKLFTYYWNNFKCSIMPGNANRSDIPIPKEKRNHKRRKKLKFGGDLKETDIEECFGKKDIKHTRNLRISAFLAELEWTKRDYRKDKDIYEGDNSFIHTHRTPASNRIVGMVQLKSLPFQRRGAPENELNNSKDKKCLSAKKQPATGLFVTLSKLVSEKFYAKKTLDRHRNKIDTVPESPSSSLVHRMMSSVSAVRGISPFNRESSICISKRASVYRTSSQELTKHSNIVDTDMLFQNAKYGNKMQVPSEEIQSHLFTESSDFLGKEIIVCSSSEKKAKVTRRCKCGVYEDLQRKWDHIKKSFSEIPGTRNPLSMLKNFCSSLFEPTCTADTCTKRRERKEKDKSARKKTKNWNTDPTNMQCKESCTNKPAGCQTQTQEDRETQLVDEEEVVDAIKNARFAQEKKRFGKEEVRLQEVQLHEAKVHKGIQVAIKPEMESRSCQVAICSNYCHREQQCEEEATAPKTSGPTSEDIVLDTVKAVGSYMCLSDESVQIIPHEVCTCATQHSGLKVTNMRHRQVNSMVETEMLPANPVVNKKTQHTGTEVAHKRTHCTARKHDKKDAKTGVLAGNHKLSLESSLLFNRDINIAKALKDELTDYTITDTSNSSISLRSNGSKTDTTICSLATINYDGTRRRRKYRLKVFTKQNQSTLTEKTLVCDTGTITDDWWSPLIERKANDPILLEKKRGFNLLEKQKKELRELKEWRELRDVRKRRRTSGVLADGRGVTFRSRTQIIPPALFPVDKDIMSPSRYLLESQKYYNELFAYKYHPRTQAAYSYVTQIPKYREKEKARSPVRSRRNHHRKTKRLDECYSPRRQLSPRKRKTESARTSDSPRRKTSHLHHRQSNNRHNAKNNSPRKRV